MNRSRMSEKMKWNISKPSAGTVKSNLIIMGRSVRAIKSRKGGNLLVENILFFEKYQIGGI